MPGRLQEELKQSKPWSSLEEEAALNIARTAAMLDHALAQALKPHGITATQYNVLRILRGAGDPGLCRNEVGERLIRSVPDVTRLLDRMEQLGLIDRVRSGTDRRYVTTRITARGLELLSSLDDDIVRFNREQLGHLDAGRLRTLVEILEAARNP